VGKWLKLSGISSEALFARTPLLFAKQNKGVDAGIGEK